VLVEEARTNLCLYSDDFTNAAWVKSNLTAAKTATGPDGVTNSASTLTATAANATAQQAITSASAARITSMFVKRRTGTGAVYLSQGATTGSELVVNGTFPTDTTGWTATAATLAVVSGELEVTNTGASAGFADSDAFATVVGTAYIVGYTARRGTSSSVGIEVKTAGGTEASVTITSTSNVNGFLYFVASSTSTFIRVTSNQAVLGRTGYFDNLSCKAASETTVTVTSDWTRVATASATVTNPPLIIRMATSGDAIDVALFQNELGAFITSPIATVASQVTRAADQISILTSAFPYVNATGTAVIDFRPTYVDQGLEFQFYAFFYFESSIRFIRMKLETTTSRTGEVDLNFRGDSTITLSSSSTYYSPGTQVMKWGVSWDAAVVRGAIDGGTLSAEATAPATPPSPTIVYFGAGGTSSFINGHIKRFAHYASLKSQTELNTLTAL
jgi:hypothetical protein